MSMQYARKEEKVITKRTNQIFPGFFNLQLPTGRYSLVVLVVENKKFALGASTEGFQPVVDR